MSAEPINERPFEPGDTYQGLPVPRAPMALTVAERAAAVFTAVPSEEDLRELAKKSQTITEITNEAGKDQCHASRMVLKNTRLEIARVGEDGREDAVQTSKAIISIQKARIALISGEEDRLAAIQKKWDDRIAAEKERKIQEELARVAEIQRRIEGIRGWAINATGQPSMLIGQMLASAKDYRIDPEVFEEHAESAQIALTVSVAALTGLLAQAKEREEKEAQLERDRIELARLREEAAERDRVAAIARAKQEAEDKAKREAEEAAAREANRLERDRIAAETAAASEVLRQQRMENDRIASERAAELAKAETLAREAREAEAKRLATEQAETDRKNEVERRRQAEEAGRIAAARAALEAEQAAAAEAARKAAEPKPETKPRHVERPTVAQLISCVASHYGVSAAMAEKWLRNMQWSPEVA